MLLELQKGIIYGPVNSRRLGESLGINILPSKSKVCAFNCVYCQYGWTKFCRAHPAHDIQMPSVKAVRDALEDALVRSEWPPAYITFSGNGEPTLHPDFNHIVEEVIAARNKRASEAKTAILSNSALVTNSTVKKALAKLDFRIMKLDCGSSRTFKRYNQPAKGIDLEEITRGLAEISDVTIQTLVSSGKNGNFNPKNIKEWVERLKRIKPLFVQLYTLDRGYPAKNIKPTSREKLNKIKALVLEAGISIRIY